MGIGLHFAAGSTGWRADAEADDASSGSTTTCSASPTVVFAENPDILALQEYFPEQSALDALLKPKYPYSVRCQGGKRANLGLYSKIPFDKEMSPEDCPSDAYGKQRTAHIIAGFTLADGTHFSVMTTHMDWPFPIDRQKSEFETAEAAANDVQGPLLVVGDFNSTPWSYAMKGFQAATGFTRETRALVTYPLEIYRAAASLSQQRLHALRRRSCRSTRSSIAASR